VRVKISIWFDSGHQGPEGSIRAMDFLNGVFLFQMSKGIFAAAWYKTLQIIKSNFMLHVRNQRHIPGTVTSQGIKASRSVHSTLQVMKPFNPHLFYMGYTGVTLPSPVSTANASPEMAQLMRTEPDFNPNLLPSSSGLFQWSSWPC
jgi:hypothetical protein